MWGWVFIVVGSAVFLYSVIDRICTLIERVKGVDVKAETVVPVRTPKVIPGTTIRNKPEGMSEP